MNALRRLQHEAAERGDECLSLLLSGIELYVRIGVEFELLETMRAHADELREAVRQTPSAEELKRLFEG